MPIKRLLKHYRGEDCPQRWGNEEFIAWLDAWVESVRAYYEEVRRRLPTARLEEVFDEMPEGTVCVQSAGSENVRAGGTPG